MTIYFSKIANGFYDTNIHSQANIPTDAIEISSTLHESIFQGQAEGKQISSDEVGNPVLIDRVDTRSYKQKREAGYPPITDYIDGVVKGDQAQIDTYIAACQAVKAKYPKE